MAGCTTNHTFANVAKGETEASVIASLGNPNEIDGNTYIWRCTANVGYVLKITFDNGIVASVSH
ncbi:hypothetical protein LPJ66_001194 [Kickxella alabastrina]|uniref:Uncharacterized protein n=1 Tax=Kickxella alabastrina TaxID=61397 RepID=A0ACC1ITZ0_9FUNG|nr:hypothetical protein LPJ66_001194 [Kickxella alabastrina]